MGQQAQGQVGVPTGPAAACLIPQAQALFAFRETGFKGPAHAGEPDPVIPRPMGGPMTKIGLEGVGVWLTAQEPPDVRSGPWAARGHHAQGREVGVQGTLAADFHRPPWPGAGGPWGRHVPDRLGAGFSGCEPRPRPRTTLGRGRRHPRPLIRVGKAP